jgi:hypothetical protein
LGQKIACQPVALPFLQKIPICRSSNKHFGSKMSGVSKFSALFRSVKSGVGKFPAFFTKYFLADTAFPACLHPFLHV